MFGWLSPAGVAEVIRKSAAKAFAAGFEAGLAQGRNENVQDLIRAAVLGRLGIKRKGKGTGPVVAQSPPRRIEGPDA